MDNNRLIEIPEALQDYFNRVTDGSLTGYTEIELNLLGPGPSMQLTQTFRKFHPLVIQMEGVVLDDPNTSNHHICLLAQPCDGAILYLSHDGASRIVFPGPHEFLDSARQAKETSQGLTALHPATGVLLPDQAGLHRFIANPDNAGECDYTELVCALLPSSDLSDLGLLEQLARDDDFYVVEAVADAITARPRRELMPIAQACRADTHPQSARAGERAVSAIKAIGFR